MDLHGSDYYTVGKMAVLVGAGPGLVDRAIRDMSIRPAFTINGQAHFDGAALDRLRAALSPAPAAAGTQPATVGGEA